MVTEAPAPFKTDLPNSREPRLGRSERVYALLLRAYPPQFRADYRDEMVVLFGDQLREARATSGAAGISVTWIRNVLDLVSSAIGEHIRKEPTVARSSAVFEPTRPMRLLGLLGLVGGLLLLWAFFSFNPFETRVANTIRLVVFALGGAAIAVAFYRPQALVARSLTLVTTGAVVLGGVVFAAWTALALWLQSPFSGTFGDFGFWFSTLLWLSAAVYGAAMLRIGAAWQGMPRWRALATRLGAVALLGSFFAWLGIDRLGLVGSEPYGQLWSSVAQAGVFLNGIGWVVLGAVLALGRRGARHTA